MLAQELCGAGRDGQVDILLDHISQTFWYERDLKEELKELLCFNNIGT